MNPIKRISEILYLEKNKLLEILDSSTLQPRQRATRGCMLTRKWLGALLTQSGKLSFYIFISLSSLLIRIKGKSTCRCVGAISNTLLIHVKVQIHTKDLTHTLCKDKQEPH